MLGIAAAIMLMIGARSGFAAPQCQPCPADCSMTMAAAPATHGAQPHHQDPGNPCKMGLACHSLVTPPQVVASPAIAPIALAAVTHAALAASAPTSRPPDRDLRPPIFA